MANCPNCGSEHVQLTRDTNVSWGHAVAAWDLVFVGMADMLIMEENRKGEDHNVNSCMNCGTSWKAVTLYATLQIIKQLTTLKLDLSMDNHRAFMKEVIPEITIYSDSISKVEKEIKININAVETRGAAVGIVVGFFISLIMIIIYSEKSQGFLVFVLTFIIGLFIYFIFFGAIGAFFGSLFDKFGDKKEKEKSINKVICAGKEKNSKIESDFQTKVKQIKFKNKLLII